MRRQHQAALWGVLTALAVLLVWGAGLRADQPKDTPKKETADQPKETSTPKAEREARVKELRTALEKARKDMEKAMLDMQKAREAYVREMRKLAEESARPFPGRPGRPPGGLSPRDGVRLGIQPEPPGPTLRAQLDLPEGKGVIVARVLPDSPAAKAGLKEQDILLKLAGKDVPSRAEELRALLADIKSDNAVDAVVLRKGKRETIKGLKLADGERGRGERPRRPRPQPPVDKEGRLQQSPALPTAAGRTSRLASLGART